MKRKIKIIFILFIASFYAVAQDTTSLKASLTPDKFVQYWFNEPVSQGNSGTCWSFATTSFFESEIYRISGKKIKLSEMYFVYWEYIERTKYYIKHKGNCTLGEGSESNAVPRLMLDYGALPLSEYSGLKANETKHNHAAMVKEIISLMSEIKLHAAWNDSIAVVQVKEILNKYMLTPPDLFQYEGTTCTPSFFLRDICSIIPTDYYSFMSNNEFTFNEKAELVEDDNWWHGANYYNVKIDDFSKIVKSAIKNGYTICICGDVTEPGFDFEKQTVIVPEYDIPAAYIDDNARQLRFSNGTTTDDHCVHLVGYKVIGDKYWLLVKDSNAGSFNNKFPGYKYINEDYIRLKMMNLLLYKYGADEILNKIIK